MLSGNYNAGSLFKKYRPATLSDIRGQSPAVSQLLSFVASVEQVPESSAFLFYGPSGVGKTAAANALAADLGCSQDSQELGGMHEVPSGQQDGQSVVDLMRLMRLRPMFGSGWKVAIINEADTMTAGAAAMWLDALEHLPPKTAVVFTTNNLEKLPARFIGRCELVPFCGDTPEFSAGLYNLIRSIWKAETGNRLRRIPDDIGRIELCDPTLSIRLAMQQIAPYIRQGEELPQRFACPLVRSENPGREAAQKAWATRRRKASNNG